MYKDSAEEHLIELLLDVLRGCLIGQCAINRQVQSRLEIVFNLIKCAEDASSLLLIRSRPSAKVLAACLSDQTFLLRARLDRPPDALPVQEELIRLLNYDPRAIGG